MNNPKFNSLLDKMKETHDKKNSDYANDLDPYSNFSFAASFAGTQKLQVYLTLLGVKAARLIELLGKNKEAKNESIDDTLLDFAVYASLMASDLMKSTIIIPFVQCEIDCTCILSNRHKGDCIFKQKETIEFLICIFCHHEYRSDIKKCGMPECGSDRGHALCFQSNK